MKVNTAYGVSKTLGEDMLYILCNFYEMRVTLDGDRTSLLEKRGVYYLVHDNGGELNVEQPNLGKIRSIPYTYNGQPLNAATMAYRVYQVVNDKPIDYEYLVDDATEAHLRQR